MHDDQREPIEHGQQFARIFARFKAHGRGVGLALESLDRHRGLRAGFIVTITQLGIAHTAGCK